MSFIYKSIAIVFILSVVQLYTTSAFSKNGITPGKVYIDNVKVDIKDRDITITGVAHNKTEKPITTIRLKLVCTTELGQRVYPFTVGYKTVSKPVKNRRTGLEEKRDFVEYYKIETGNEYSFEHVIRNVIGEIKSCEVRMVGWGLYYNY